MIMSEIKINSEFWYNSGNKLTIAIAHNALSNYAEKFLSALKLEDKSIPIILDTNVLLAYYGMSQQEKKKLITFLNENSNRLFITHQVEKEFLKNRLNIIKKEFFSPLEKIETDFKSTYKEIKDKFKRFIDDKKRILSNDYPEIWQELIKKEQKINEMLGDEENLLDKIKKAIETTTTDYKNIYVTDKLLEACSKLRITPPLNEEEIKFVQEQYDDLWQKYNSETNESKKREIIFPGCGDKKEKESDPYGDFIIFHEILKFMVVGVNGSGQTKTDVIFLTREKAKGDWMHDDLKPIIHYIEKVYLLTGKTLFIIHAEKPLEITFENIHKNNKTTENDLILRESTIVNINHDENWAFAYSRLGNLYFNRYLMLNPEEFQFLNKDEVVRYKIGKNSEGEDIAIDVEKVIYSFDDVTQKIYCSQICNIDKNRGYGFVDDHPQNLYFHQSFLDKGTVFDDLNIGDNLEYIVGRNEQGEYIIRLARKVLTINNTKETETND